MFHGAQTFYVDSSPVAGATEIHLSRVRLFFKARPHATNNKSGIHEPGVTVFYAPVENGIPVISNIDDMPRSRLGYHSIRTSSDASEPTDFLFPELVDVSTGREHSFVIQFDGDEDFILWKSTQGEALVGTANTPSPGSSGQFTGKWYEFISDQPSANANPTSQTGLVSTDPLADGDVNDTDDFIATSWKPLSTVDLKFSVFCARFSINGNTDLSPISEANVLLPPEAVITAPTTEIVQNTQTGTVTYNIPASRYEYIGFDYRRSRYTNFRRGERAWQHTRFYPNDKTPMTVSLTAGSNRVTTGNGNFSQVFSQGINPEYVVFTSLNHNGGANTVCVRRVVQLVSNTVMVLDNVVPFTNSSAYFYKAPVGIVDWVGRAKIDGKSSDLLILKDSNANGSTRFVNSAIQEVRIIGGGTGYSNSDVITISGYENVPGKVVGGFSARAVITTNSTGGIVATHMANLGAGFVNSAAIVASVANSTGGSTTGSGATFSYDVGMMVASEFSYVRGSDGYVSEGRLLNPAVSDIFMVSAIRNPLGTFLSCYLRLVYYRVRDPFCYGGWRYHCDYDRSHWDHFYLTPGRIVFPLFKKSRVLASWSNEIAITYENSGNTSNGAGVPANLVSNTTSSTSNGSVIEVIGASNTDFTVIRPGPVTLVFSRYLVNDDYSGENTDYGEATAKGFTQKVTFANSGYAEDIRVYATVWKPANTDLKVYARVHNALDVEAFDDKDWTLLEQKDGIGLVSSSTDADDMLELSWGFPQWPNAEFTVAGTVTLANGSSNVVGVGTDFSNVSAGDLIRVYQPLFPNTNHQVFLVNSVTNSTHLTVSTAPSNNGILGGGLKVDKIEFKNQAFNNMMNDNVVRYYSSSMGEFDTYSTMQVKVVFLADEDNLVPKVDDLRVVGVSA